MPLEPQRYKYYKTQLGDSLQSATALIRHYYTTLGSQTSQLIVQANRIWELSQRHRLLAGIKEAAAATLLSACHDAYQPIYHSIFEQRQDITLTDGTLHVTDDLTVLFSKELHFDLGTLALGAGAAENFHDASPNNWFVHVFCVI
ncbi:hypothetical protein AWZ03_013701 [Drosophila navojoa]|uniref:Uncharacterized protein n=1 Tax=Drosophila navojoa TaxID=7232 RepID=A0A484ATV2_DRONA|nr:hypothetical protein AWZ03_013701 [Drosophila navojoa]